MCFNRRKRNLSDEREMKKCETKSIQLIEFRFNRSDFPWLHISLTNTAVAGEEEKNALNFITQATFLSSKKWRAYVYGVSIEFYRIHLMLSEIEFGDINTFTMFIQNTRTHTLAHSPAI